MPSIPPFNHKRIKKDEKAHDKMLCKAAEIALLTAPVLPHNVGLPE
jgi:hypothetical protein